MHIYSLFWFYFKTLVWTRWEHLFIFSFSFRMMASCMQVLLFMGEPRHWGCGCALRFIASTPVCRAVPMTVLCLACHQRRCFGPLAVLIRQTQQRASRVKSLKCWRDIRLTQFKRRPRLLSEWIIPARQSPPQQLPLQFVTMHSYKRLSACNRWAEDGGGRVGGQSAAEGSGA